MNVFLLKLQIIDQNQFIMKKLIQLLLIPLFLIVFSCEKTEKRLENIDIDSAMVIYNDNISESTIDKQTVLNVNIKELKDGFHYVNYPNGNKVFVDVSKGNPNAVYLTNKAGNVLKGVYKVGNSQLGFSCSEIACDCQGDDDCNDMFSTDVCGANAVCFGEPPFCICERSIS